MKFVKRKYYQLYISFLKLIGANAIKISKVKYLYKNDKELNLENPIEFMEKIQWLKLFLYKEDYGYLVDKYEVRAFVENRIGAQYLNDIIGIYNNPDEINIDLFPNQFALKATHGSGYNIIVCDKEKLNWSSAKSKLNKFLKSDYSKFNGEAIYKNVKPRILAEKFLSESENDYIIDYKFFCFHGEAKYVWVKTFCSGKYRNCYYDLQWNKITDDNNKYCFLEKEMKKPINFDEMISISEKLSKDFIFVRVDLYSVSNKVYFGELTFFPWGGKQRLTVERFNDEFGKLIKL